MAKKGKLETVRGGGGEKGLTQQRLGGQNSNGRPEAVQT